MTKDTNRARDRNNELVGLETQTATLTHGAVYTLLANPTRRHVVTALDIDGEPWTLEDLSRYVVAREYEALSERSRSRAVDDVATSLYHAHLPKLEQSGVISYDQGRERITATPTARTLREVLQTVEQLVEPTD
jgi:hypothetical protein